MKQPIAGMVLSISTAAPLALSADASGSTGSSLSTLDLREVFNSCPIIYSILLIMSIVATAVWIYSVLTLRQSDLMPQGFIDNIRNLLKTKQYDAALETCRQQNSMAASIIANGISARHHGPQVVIEAMQLEGKRKGNTLWQRISLLNEVAVIAPMIGLLGTVLGLFFAFYDANRSAESIASIFDGLGIAVGTTVAGLIVAIFAMIYYTTLKFRVVNLLNTIENESFALATMIDAGDGASCQRH